MEVKFHINAEFAQDLRVCNVLVAEDVQLADFDVRGGQSRRIDEPGGGGVGRCVGTPSARSE